jgi:hypothetical protein
MRVTREIKIRALRIKEFIFQINSNLLTGFYLSPPALLFTNNSILMKWGGKCAKLKDPQLNCFLCMSSVQLRRGMSYMHHFSLLTMTINRVNP